MTWSMQVRISFPSEIMVCCEPSCYKMLSVTPVTNLTTLYELIACLPEHIYELPIQLLVGVPESSSKRTTAEQS